MFHYYRYYHINRTQKSEKKLAKKVETQVPLAQAVFILAAVILFFRLIFSFFPKERLWGLNQAGFLPGFPLIYPILFIISVYLYLRGQKKPEIFSTGEISTGPTSIFKRLMPLYIFIIAFFMFYILATDSHFLGDGYQLLSYMSQPHPILRGRADGEMRIQLLYQQIFALGDKYDGYRTFRNLSILAGLIFMSGLLYYGRRLFKSLFSYYSFIAINFISAITILYYGYVEVYSLTTAATFIFILSGTAALKNQKKSIVPIVAYLAALFLHPVNMVYLPSFLIYLLYLVGGEKGRTFLLSRGRKLLYIAAGGFIIMYAAIKLLAPEFWQLAFLPIMTGRFTLDGYTLFSIKHLTDFVNLLFFVVPISVIMIIVPEITREKRERKVISLEKNFLLMAAASGLLSAFILEPKLGMPRDWDLMSTMLIGTQIAGIYYWFDRYQKHSQFQTATAIMIMIGLSIFVPWLALNYSRLGLYKYNMAVMELDPKHSRAGFYSIGEMMQKAGDKNEAERIIRYCDYNFPEVRIDKEGAAMYKKGQLPKALELFDRSIDLNPAWFGPYLDKGICLISMGRAKEALEALEIADALNPYSADTYRNMGDAYNLLGDKDPALLYWKKSLTYGPGDYKIYFALGQYYLNNNMPDTAISYYTALPDSAYPREVLYQLGVAEMKKGDTAKSRKYFDDYLSVGKDSTIIRNIIRFESQF